MKENELERWDRHGGNPGGGGCTGRPHRASFMKKPKIYRNTIMQIGFLTWHLDTAMKYWNEYFGFEPSEISVTLPYEQTHAVYNGQPCYGRNRTAYYNFDNVQMEIIEPYGEEPSYWRECLERNGEGFHHIALQVKNTDACIQHLVDTGMGEFKMKGEFPGGVFQEQTFSGGRYSYVDTKEKLGFIAEFLELDTEDDEEEEQ